MADRKTRNSNGKRSNSSKTTKPGTKKPSKTSPANKKLTKAKTQSSASSNSSTSKSQKPASYKSTGTRTKVSNSRSSNSTSKKTTRNANRSKPKITKTSAKKTSVSKRNSSSKSIVSKSKQILAKNSRTKEIDFSYDQNMKTIAYTGFSQKTYFYHNKGKIKNLRNFSETHISGGDGHIRNGHGHINEVKSTTYHYVEIFLKNPSGRETSYTLNNNKVSVAQGHQVTMLSVGYGKRNTLATLVNHTMQDFFHIYTESDLRKIGYLRSYWFHIILMIGLALLGGIKGLPQSSFYMFPGIYLALALFIENRMSKKFRKVLGLYCQATLEKGL